MNRHEDELEQKIADKYIESMDAPDIWGRIESGLDVVDAQRNQDKNQPDSRKAYGNRKTAQIISGLVAAAVVCVLVIAGPLRNSWKSASDKSVQENSVIDIENSDESTDGSDMVAESYSNAESAAAPADKTQSNDAHISDSAPESFDVQKSQEYQGEAPGDYAPMIMVGGVLYKDTYDMVDADSVDESKALYAESYTDGMPTNDGEVNFDRNPSKNSAYVVCDDGSIIVKVEGNWYRFERAE